MMRSLYSGISGLRNHQTRMDVIGNNIANVNTTGYKTSRVIFQDIFSQTASGGTSSTPQLGIGGTNPMQIGLGVILSSIDVMHNPAPTQRTDNAFDMMIGGDGFFIVEGPDGYFYTRAGNFKADDEGFLVTTDGYFVMGYTCNPRIEEIPIEYLADGTPVFGSDEDLPPKFGVVIDKYDDEGNLVTIRDAGYLTANIGYDKTKLSRIQLKAYSIEFYPGADTGDWTLDLTGYDPADWEDQEETGPPWDSLEGFSVGKNGEVTIIANNRKVTISQIAVAMFANPGGLEKAGNSLYRETSSSGLAEFTEAYQNGAGPITGGGLEMSNVDLATEFTDMIVTQRGFQANSRVITVSDTMLEELVNLKR